MKMDSKSKAASNPARLKTNHSKHTGSDTGKKPDRSVTRSKRAKGHLPGIEQRLLGTYEHAPIGIIENSLEGNYVNCNEEFCRITGYRKEELLSLNIKDLTYEEDYIFDIKLHQRLVAGEIPFYKLEKRYVRKDGQLIWAEVSRSLMHDADGKPLYTIGAVLDVSERRQAEKALRDSEEKYRTLFNSIDEGFCIIEKLEGRAGEPLDFRYTAANPAFAAQSGVGNVVGKTIRQAFPGEPEEWFETYDTILRTGNAIRFERNLVTQGRVLELYAFRVEDEMHPRIAVIFKDITGRKQAEEALQFARDQAQQTADRIARLQKVTAALSEALTPSQVARIVVAQGASALGAETATMLLLAEDGEHLEIVHSAAPQAITAPYQRFSISLNVPAADAARSGQPIWIESRQQYLERYPHLADQINLWGYQSAVAIPMLDKGRTFGVLTLSFDRILAYTPEDQDYALTLAQQGAQALERARLYEAEQRARRAVTEFAGRQEVLYTLADQLHRTNLLDDVFNAALDAIISGLQCDRASILLYDNSQVMRFVAWRGLSAAYRKATDGHSPWQPDEKQAEPICINDINSAELSDSLRTVIEGEGIGSLAFIPLISSGKLIGKFMAYFNVPHVFSEGELDLSLTLARQLAFGIDRKRAEEALRASEALYRAIARSIPGGGVYVVDKDLRYLVAEGPVTEAFGFTPEMLEGHTVSEVFPAETSELMKERLQQNLAGETISYETKHNGRVYWTQQAPLLDSLGHAIVVTMDITERKQIEEALRQSEERFARFMQHLPGLAWIKDVQGRYVYVNAAAEKAFSTPQEKLYGKTDQDVFPPGVATQFKINDENALTDGKGVQVVETLEHADGVLHYSLVNKFPIPGPDGSTALIGGTAFDITERKQAEEALRDSRERYRNLFDLVPVAVYSCDAEGLIQEYNQRAVDLWGREPRQNDPNERYCGSFKIYYPDGRFMPHEKCPMARMLGGETLEAHELEILVERPDGVRRSVLAHPLPVKNEHGEIIGAINCLYDITERKQAEEALQQLNLQLESRVQRRTERLNEVIEALREEILERKRAEGQLVYQAHLIANVNDAIIATDANLAISYWNQAAEQIYGWKAEEVLGRSVSEVLRSEFLDGNTRRGALQKVRETGELRSAVTHLRKDGSRIFIDAHTSTLRNGEDSTVGYISVNHDITERTQMDEALRNSRERLQMLSRRLVEVQEEERRAIARELHDRVGQTLAALNINLMIMNGQLLDDSKQRIGSRMADTMHLVADAIALVRNVMTDLRPAVLDDYGLEAALQSYIDEYQSRYDIKVFLDPPEQPIPRLGPSLEMTLLRIAQEALFNIARHAQADQVNISLQLQDDAVHMMVQDNGVGIQSWQEANRPGSHGLTIMRERADAFGGRLNVGSDPGKGTKVEVSIPLQNGNQNKIQEEKQV